MSHISQTLSLSNFEYQITTACYKSLLSLTSTMLRGCTIGLIFTRALSLREGINDNLVVVTLMSTDVDTISDAVTRVHEIWAQFIEVIISFWLLSKKARMGLNRSFCDHDGFFSS